MVSPALLRRPENGPNRVILVARLYLARKEVVAATSAAGSKLTMRAYSYGRRMAPEGKTNVTPPATDQVLAGIAGLYRGTESGVRFAISMNSSEGFSARFVPVSVT